MAEERSHRRLAAILAADVVGYTRLMELDEAGTLAALKGRRKNVLDPLVSKYHGRVFKVTGDGVLVEFASAVNAVECAIALQRAFTEANVELPEDRRIVLRIGINLGDLALEGGDLYGNGVIIATRLEAMAEPGAILLSGAAFDQIKGRVKANIEDFGRQTLKNVSEPVRIYSVHDTKQGDVSTPRGSTSDRPSIAVLPFTNMSGDPEQEYFSDGITEDIITELSRFRSLFVIARNSSFQYKGKNVDVKRVGRELGVQYLVEGSIRRSGDKVRVTAQLIETETGNHNWAERYDRDAQDIFALQDDLAHAVAATVGGRIEKAGVDRSHRLSPSGLKAYDLYLRAKGSMWKFTKHDNAEARKLLHEAMMLDSSNADIMAHYANSSHIDAVLDWCPDPDRAFETALKFARNAVSLDDGNSTAQWILGCIQLFMHKHPEARVHLEKAIDANPNDTEARWIYSCFLSYVGEPDKALEQIGIARQHYPQGFVYSAWLEGIALFSAKEYDKAITLLSQVNEPDHEVIGYQMASYAHLGKMEEARSKLDEFLDVTRRDMEHFPDKDPKQWRAYFRRMAPFKNEKDFEHLLDGMRKVGLPV